METLSKKEYEMVKNYKKTHNQEIALYFLKKFEPDLTKLIYFKINKKFSSVPFEKGDLFYFIWNGIKKTLANFKKGDNFNVILVQNCYLSTLNEVRKFISNGELIMNMSYSLEQYNSKFKKFLDRNIYIENRSNNKIALQNLIDLACEYITSYTPKTIKKVIYLKSLGYKKEEIARELKISSYYVSDLLKILEKMVNEMKLL